MARLDTFIPFVLHFAAGLSPRHHSIPLEQQFEIARHTGWSDDPDDSGGATMIDITLRTYAAYRRRKHILTTTKSDLRNITYQEWHDILKSFFWDAWKADEINSPGVAHLLVDWLWASGPGSIRMAQTILNVKSDGHVGPVTLRAVNNQNPGELFRKLHSARENHYRRCKGAWKYLNGWMRRLKAIRPDGSFRF